MPRYCSTEMGSTSGFMMNMRIWALELGIPLGHSRLPRVRLPRHRSLSLVNSTSAGAGMRDLPLPERDCYLAVGFQRHCLAICGHALLDRDKSILDAPYSVEQVGYAAFRKVPAQLSSEAHPDEATRRRQHNLLVEVQTAEAVREKAADVRFRMEAAW